MPISRRPPARRAQPPQLAGRRCRKCLAHSWRKLDHAGIARGHIDAGNTEPHRNRAELVGLNLDRAAAIRHARVKSHMHNRMARLRRNRSSGPCIIVRSHRLSPRASSSRLCSVPNCRLAFSPSSAGGLGPGVGGCLCRRLSWPRCRRRSSVTHALARSVSTPRPYVPA
jgi:hypothetical protein